MKMDRAYVICGNFIGEEKCFFLNVEVSVICDVLWNLLLIVDILKL